MSYTNVNQHLHYGSLVSFDSVNFFYVQPLLHLNIWFSEHIFLHNCIILFYSFGISVDIIIIIILLTHGSVCIEDGVYYTSVDYNFQVVERQNFLFQPIHFLFTP